jgi:hypothetical protein
MDTFNLRAYLNDNRLLQEQSIFEFMDKSKIQDLIDKAVVKKEDNEEEVKESLSVALITAMPVLLGMAGSSINWIYNNLGVNKEQTKAYKEIKKQQQDIADRDNIGTKMFGKRFISFDNPLNDSPKEKAAKKEIKDLDKKIDKELGTKVGDMLISGGHQLHKAYVTPILLFLEGIAALAPEDSKLKSLDYRKKVANIVYAGAMIAVAGYGIYESLKHLHGVKDAAAAMIELAEEGASVGEVVDAGLVAGGVKAGLTVKPK